MSDIVYLHPPMNVYVRRYCNAPELNHVGFLVCSITIHCNHLEFAVSPLLEAWKDYTKPASEYVKPVIETRKLELVTVRTTGEYFSAVPQRRRTVPYEIESVGLLLDGDPDFMDGRSVYLRKSTGFLSQENHVLISPSTCYFRRGC